MGLRGLNGKVALVTGAGRGIGEGIGRRLIEEGCRVCLVDIDLGEWSSAGSPDILPIVADVSTEAGWETCLRATTDRFGTLDFLVNNAGILGDPLPLKDTSIDIFDRVVAVNLRSMFIGMREAIRIMEPKGAGAIVNIASISAYRPNPARTPYAASKAGVIALTQGAAVGCGSSGIRINAVAPGAVDTPMSKIVDQTRAAGGDRMAVTSRPIQRKAQPYEIAAAVAWLLSDESGFVTGSVYRVDGGALS